MRARALIALVLLGLQGFVYVQGGTQVWLLLICTAYLAATVVVLILKQHEPPAPTGNLQWGMTLWIDLAVFAVLQIWSQGGINYTPLFVLPVLLASILGPLLLALGSAAAATLVILFDIWEHTAGQFDLATARYLQGALTGSGLFLVALLANQLALRLAREHKQALQNNLIAQAQSDVNALIVTGLSEGVVVMGVDGRIWHTNPAARAMLTVNEPREQLQEAPGWSALRAWMDHALFMGQTLEGELTVPLEQGGKRKLYVRALLTSPQPEHPEMRVCVMFLEDLHDVEIRVQNEKLAAMGRVSAAVAHEIRNPLAAITQANALLEEDATEPSQQRLTAMIGQNARRLARTVDDILNLVRTEPLTAPHAGNTPVLDECVQEVVCEWLQQHPQEDRVTMQLDARQHRVHFEPDHLHRVLNNLLDNAHKHAEKGRHNIAVQTSYAAHTQTVTLSVWSNSPALPEPVQQHLFEPFTSSNSRSSGLGLYICRELCQRYHAHLSHQRQRHEGREGNAFTVSLPIWPAHPTHV